MAKRTRTNSSFEARRKRFVAAVMTAVAMTTVAVTLYAQSFPAYDRSDEGSIWQYIGTIGKSVDHCFSNAAARAAKNFDLCAGVPDDNDLFGPSGVAAFGSGSNYRLYVADRSNNRVVVFGSTTSLQGTPNGEHIATFAAWNSAGN